MGTPSIEERGRVCGRLREVAGATCGLTDGEFTDLLGELAFDSAAWAVDATDPDAVLLNRPADLIDPTAHERTVADNLRIIDRNLQLECELAALKARLGRAARIARDLKGGRGQHLRRLRRPTDSARPREDRERIP